MATAQQPQYTLPPKALEEMRQMAKDRKNVPSPRGAADFHFSEVSRGAPEAVGSNDTVQQKLSDEDINNMICTFLTQLVKSATILTEYCYRLDMEPADVAEAKERFAANDEEDDEDWVEENETAEDDNNMDDDGDDDALSYDSESSSENDDSVYIDDEKYQSKNAYTPKFDALYSPVGEIVHLTDETFYKEILEPIFLAVRGFNFEAAGVSGIFKRAMYAYVVAALCASSE